MRNPIAVLKSLEEKAKQKGYVFERLYRNLYNPEFYLLAYQNIAKSQGSMTAGTDGMTLDDMTVGRIERIIASLKDHSYQPNPARREYIPKKNNPSKTRPLGIPSTDDKLVQEVVRMLLEAIYEPTFSQYSHGFRPKRSCHTALSEIKTIFNGVQWVIEGDIKACFDSFDHHVLIDILRRRIKDEHFIALMWKMLKAGYMEQWTYHRTYSGTPQGSGVSPILANIYLSELDRYLEEYRNQFNAGKQKQKANREYLQARQQYRAQKALLGQFHTKEMVRDFKQAQQKMLSIPYYSPTDKTYKSLQFNRYADDFVVGVIGSRKDAEQIKADIRDFLANTLKLTLSEEKTKITHSSELIDYLGYQFSVRRSKDTKRDKNGVLRRLWYGKVALYVPHGKWVQKLKEYQAFKIVTDHDGKERWKPLHRGKLMHKDALAIVSQFNAEIRGLYNYYRLAENVSVLNCFYFIMKGSLLKTLAAKGNTTCNKIRKKYERNGVISIPYVTKSGPKWCEFYHDGFTKKKELPPLTADVLPQYVKYDRPNSLAKRLKAGICELCGAETKEVHMHHVRRLKDLTGKDELERKMMLMRRKSIALCPECYVKTKHAK
ncbi:MAG: group II intron reverse transcriptase/maturase [Lachnospiraceae bacterium]|nr:group II intron reverse transcriptase/maturase [Lachnospiraceae bacterium]